MKEKFKHRIFFSLILASVIVLVWALKVSGVLFGALQVFSENLLMLLVVPLAILIWAGVMRSRYKEKYFGKHFVFLGKTGILTKGNPELTDVIPSPHLTVSSDRLLQLASSLAQLSDHPYSKGLFSIAQDKGLDLIKPRKFRQLPGLGIEGEIAQRKAKLGNLTFMKEGFVEVAGLSEQVERLFAEGKNVVFVAYDGELIGILGFYDEPKEELKDIIKGLHQKGVTVTMVTGDHKIAAENLAQKFSIERILPELKPEHKGDEIEKVLGEDRQVIMIGQGPSDEHAFSVADLAIDVSQFHPEDSGIPEELSELRGFLS